ncbi:MAG: RNA 2',3'-cyclic phosphodiesterase [Desulfobacterota bacterium]|nr:RNA 2',3'-cyclic phosphodiesterase [Thermodesulfobacteriota bacterium]MDW8001747.1 RNA 2',3'-cyclic phosphodiesterase [Deltaproteobacteria bacterium]
MRAFIALDLPDRVKTYLQTVIRTLSEKEEETRWVKSGNQHLTLKFLGEIEEGLKEKIIAVLKSSTQGFPSVRVRLNRIEGFPDSKKARVVVITLAYGVDELKKLFEILEEGLSKIGFEKERREFVPHITLGRRKIAKALPGNIRIEPIEFVLEDLVFYKSTLTQNGPIYEPIWKVKLTERGGENAER